MRHSLQKIEKTLLSSGEALSSIIPAKDDRRFAQDFKENQRLLALNKDKASLMQQRATDLEAKMENICRDLGRLGSQKVLTRDLQSILDDLSRLDIDFQYELEEIQTLNLACEELLEASSALHELNRKQKIQEADAAVKELQAKIKDADELYQECLEKLD